jgi:uncharacterized protein with HEPN domain
LYDYGKAVALSLFLSRLKAGVSKQGFHDVARVHDRLDAARKAVSFAEGHMRPDLDSNEVLALALVRRLEIVGEAAKYILS